MHTHESVAKALNSSAFEDFFYNHANAPDRFAVAALTEADRALFGVREDVLWLSRHTLDSHIDKHPEVGIDDYRKIPEIVSRGAVWGGHADRRYVLLLVDGKPYRAAIKADAEGREAWFLSLVASGKQKPPKGAVRLR